MLELLPRFGLAPLRQALEHPLPGSPERCLARWAVEDRDHHLWMLERLGPRQAARREGLARLLERLARDPALAGFVPAYLPVDGGPDHVLALDRGPLAGFWQISPFVPGAELPRPAYLDQAWRGEALAGFLLALQRAGASWPALPAANVPPLPDYIRALLAAITRRKPSVAARLGPLRGFLETLPQVLAAQPMVLGHGDLHPLNVQWGGGPEEPVRAVIDWEFAGARPLLLDAANCMGCAGFEHPSGLFQGFVPALARACAPREFLALLPAMVLASRFGWLSEWLRKNDGEMLGMELDYCDILVRNQERLADAWTV
jgi:hypothetical protein